MNETPEAVRDRIKAEELAKGSDPRVAEGRSKAAEWRARQGLPVDPQEAWKAKLTGERGAPAAPAAVAAAQAPKTDTGPTHVPPDSSGPGESPGQSATAAPSGQPEPKPGPAAPAAVAAAQAPKTDTSPTHVPPESSGLGESPAPPAAPLEEPEPQAEPETASAGAAAIHAPKTDTSPTHVPPESSGLGESPAPPVAPAPSAAPVFAPEIGELIELDDEVVFSVGGVKVRDARIATWTLILLLSIPLWAMLYLLGLGGADVVRSTTGCIVEANRSFVCFQPKHETGSGGH